MYHKHLIIYITLPFTIFSCKEGNQSKNQNLSQKRSEILTEIEEDRRKEFEEKGKLTAEGESKRNAAKMKVLQQHREELSGDEAKGAEAGIETVEKLQIEYAALADKGKIHRENANLEKITKESDIDFMILCATEFYEADLAYCKYLDETHAEVLRWTMKDKGLSDKTVELYMAEFNETFNPNKKAILEIRAEEQKSTKAMIGALQILKANFGKWSWNKSANSVAFNATVNQETITQYNTHAKTMQQASIRMIELQKKLVK